MSLFIYKYGLWIRFGDNGGFSIKIADPVFSERQGLRKTWRIGKLMMEVLK